MSACLNTSIEFKGTIDEIKTMFEVLNDYFSNKHGQEISFIKISREDSGKAVQLSDLTEEKLNNFLKKCDGKVLVEAEGPYGHGSIEEAGIFEALADATPEALFTAVTSGFTTGGNEYFEGVLKNGKLFLMYNIEVEEENFDEEDYEDDIDIDENMDEETNCFVQKDIYDPIEHDYLSRKARGKYINLIMERMPLAVFKDLFEISEQEISDSEYRDYIQECFNAYAFPEMDYYDFKSAFTNCKLEKTEFDEKVKLAIERLDLVGYEEYFEKLYENNAL